MDSCRAMSMCIHPWTPRGFATHSRTVPACARSGAIPVLAQPCGDASPPPGYSPRRRCHRHGTHRTALTHRHGRDRAGHQDAAPRSRNVPIPRGRRGGARGPLGSRVRLPRHRHRLDVPERGGRRSCDRAERHPARGDLRRHEALERRAGLRQHPRRVREQPGAARPRVRRPLSDPLADAGYHRRDVAGTRAPARGRRRPRRRRVQLPHPAPGGSARDRERSRPRSTRSSTTRASSSRSCATSWASTG